MKNIREGLPFFTLIFIFILTAFGVIYFRTEVVSMEYKISQLQSKKTNLTKEKKIIAAHIERLSSCKNIEMVAIEKLGMQLSNRDNVHYLKWPSAKVTLAINTIIKKEILK